MAGALCIVSEIVWTKCNMGGKWVSSGFYKTCSDDSTILKSIERKRSFKKYLLLLMNGKERFE